MATDSLTPSVVTDESKVVAEYASYGGPETHDSEPIGVPILRWRHMGANTATQVGGKFYNSLEGDERAYDEVPAVILDGKNSRAYYDKPYDPKTAKGGVSSQPDCKSVDGIDGNGMYGPGSTGNPSGKCGDCPLAKWGQAGDPPRCSLSYDRLIYDFHTHQLGVISFSRTKIKAIQDFQRTIKARNGGNVPMWAYKVVLRSDRKENYFIPKIDIEGVLPREEALKFMQLKQEANTAFLRSNTGETPTPAVATTTAGTEDLSSVEDLQSAY